MDRNEVWIFNKLKLFTMPSTYRLSGKVIETKKGEPIPGLLVQAWDKDVKYTDLLGTARTDEEGAFSIPFTAEDFQDAHDRRPDVFFRVYQGEQLVCSTEEKPVLNWEEGVELEPLVIDWDKAKRISRTLKASGRVLEKEGIGVAGMIVRAYDNNPEEEKYLSSGKSDENGAFSIYYQPEQLGKAGKQRADLRILVFKGSKGKKPVATSRLIRNAGEQENIIVAIGEDIKNTVPLSLGTLAQGFDQYNQFSSLEKVFIDSKLQDYLYEKIIANLPFTKEDTKKAIKTLIPNYRQYRETLLSDLVKEFVLPRLDPEDEEVKRLTETNLAGLTGFDQKVSEVLELSLPVKKHPRFEQQYQAAKVMEIVRITGVEQNTGQQLVETGMHWERINLAYWESLIEKGVINKTQQKHLAYGFELADLTADNFKLIETVKAGHKATTTRQLAALDQKEWLKLIRKSGNETPAGEKPEEYAANIMAIIDRSFPSDFLFHRVTAKKDAANLAFLDVVDGLLNNNNAIIKGGQIPEINFGEISDEVKKTLLENLEQARGLVNTFRHLNLEDTINDKTLSANQKIGLIQGQIGKVEAFFHDNPEVDLRFADLFETSGNHLKWDSISIHDKPLVKNQLMAFQRTLHLAPDFNTASALLVKGLDSAVAISKLSLTDFIRRSGLSIAEGENIYENAEKRSVALIHNTETLREIVKSGFWNLAPLPGLLSFVNELKEVTGYQQIFGSQNYCDCPHCRSVFSPAAYFVDTMYFIEKNITQNVKELNNGKLVPIQNKNHDLFLKQRRPDLWKLELTCEHTDKRIPYLEIVNEILENYILNATKPGDVYKMLDGSNISFHLPANIHLEELRLLLQHFGMTLSEIYELTNQSDVDCSREYLKLSKSEWEVIINAGKQDIKARYQIVKFNELKVPEFLNRTGLKREELDILINLSFIKAKGVLKITVKEVLNTVNGYEELLEQSNEDILDRIHRFIRLWRKLPWTLKEFDWILMAMGATDLDINTVPIISTLAYIQAKLGLNVEELAGIAYLIPDQSLVTVEKSRNEENGGPYKEKQPSLKERLFEKELKDGIIHHPQFNEKDPTDTDYKPQISLLAGGLRISDSELVTLMGLVKDQLFIKEQGLNNDDLRKGNFYLDLLKASLLYRHARIAAALHLSIEELNYLVQLHLGDNQFISSLKQIKELINVAQNIKDSGFSLPELWFILKGKPSRSVSYLLEEDKLLALLEKVQSQDDLYFNEAIFTAIDGISNDLGTELLGILVSSKWIVQDQNKKLYRVTQTYSLDQPWDAIIKKIKDQLDGQVAKDKIALLKAVLDNRHPSTLLITLLMDWFGLSRQYLSQLMPFIRTNLSVAQFFEAFFNDEKTGQQNAKSLSEWIQEMIRELERVILLFRKLEFDGERRPKSLLFLLDNKEVFGISDTGDLNLSHVLRLAWYRDWYNPEEPQLVDDFHQLLLAYQKIITAPAPSTFKEQEWKVFAGLTQLNNSLVVSLSDQLSLGNMVNPIEALQKLKLLGAVCARLGISGLVLPKLTSGDFTKIKDGRDAVYQAFKSKYPDQEKWEEIYAPYNSRSLTLRRDILCDYFLSEKNLPAFKQFKNKRYLFEFFLLDVDMDGCMTISRLKAATLSIQLYVHRCLMNLEQSKSDNFIVKVGNEAANEWEWRKNYRIWEANRKIFLYPENYLEPAERDDKTPIFKELEDELLQEKITKEAAEKAYIKYFRQFEEVANLKIAGVHYCEGNNSYYIFGRTATDPYQYYFRQYNPCLRTWTHWTQVSLEISAPFVSPIVFKGKLFLFWVDIETTEVKGPIQNGNVNFSHYEHNIKVSYSMLGKNGGWMQPQKLDILYDANSDEEEGKPKDKEDRTSTMLIAWSFSQSIKEEYQSLSVKDDDFFYKNYRKFIYESSRTYRTIYPCLFPLSDNIYLEYTRKAKKDNPSNKRPNNLTEYMEFVEYGIHNYSVYRKLDIHLNLMKITNSLENSALQINTIVSSILAKPIFISISDSGQCKINQRITSPFNSGASLDDSLVNYQNHFSNIQLPLTKEFSRHSFNPDLRIVHNSIGDYILKLGNQQYLIRQTEKLKLNASLRGICSPLTQWLNAFSERETIRLSTSVIEKIGGPLINQGLEEFLSPQNQSQPEDSIGIDFIEEKFLAPPFEYVNTPNNRLTFDGSYGNYFRKLFFHIPFLIANQLNADQKFKEAKYWYEKIFNPALNAPSPSETKEGHWQYVEFKGLGIPDARRILMDEATWEASKKNPFNPHAIARSRISAFQKAVVMKYIDNLLDWGDHLFAKDTFESINEATMLYVLAYDILGERPQMTGKCGTVDEQALTYEKIEPAIKKESSEFLIYLENWQYKNAVLAWNDRYKNALANMNKSQAALKPKAFGYNYLYDEEFIEEMEGNKQTTTPGVPVTSALQGSGLPFLSLNGIVSTYDTFLSEQKAGSASATAVINKIPGPLFENQIKGLLTTFITEENGKKLAFCVPPNQTLLGYWDRVEDRLKKIRHCMNIQGVRRELRLYEPEIDPRLLIAGKAAGWDMDDLLSSIEAAIPPYRFSYLLEKAKSFVGTVQSFGASLQRALETKDSEQLAKIKAQHELNVLTLTKAIRENQVREAEVGIQQLMESRVNVQNRIDHYSGLISEGLIPWEKTQQVAKHYVTGYLAASEVLTMISEKGRSSDMCPKFVLQLRDEKDGGPTHFCSEKQQIWNSPPSLQR